jgi:CS domain
LGEETSFDAPWLQRAAMENLEYQTNLNNITGRSEVQKAIDGEDGIAKAEDDFSWTQTEEELEVMVPLPIHVKSKDVQVKYLPQSIQVKCRKEPLLSLSLFERIDPDGCTWTLDRDGDEQKLVITLEKVEAASWPRIKD